MKLPILFICALFLFRTSFAQKISFTDTSNIWRIKFSWLGSPNGSIEFDYLYEGDTLINGELYFDFGFGLVKNDTANHRVYVKNLLLKEWPGGIAAAVIDTNEQVLYDYNLEVGDSLHYQYVNGSFKCFVMSIDSTLINGDWHKLWYFNSYAYDTALINIDSNEFIVIEGLGSTKGPWFSMYPFEDNNHYQLICFSNNGGRPIINPVIPYEESGYFDNDTSCFLSVTEADIQHKIVLVVPNPANQYAKISMPNNIVSGKLTIINTLGEQVYMGPIENKKEISLQHKIHLPGIYYYQIVDSKHHLSFTGSFVYQ